MADERNRLSSLERYKLTQWVEKNLARFAAEGISAQIAADQAAEALGFTITARNILSLAGSNKEAMFEHRWPSNGLQAGGGPEGGHVGRRLQVVVAVLGRVVEQLQNEGCPDLLPEDLQQLWSELKAQCPVPGAEAVPTGDHSEAA